MPRPSHNTDLRLRDKLRPIARQMRHEPTPAEAKLWTHLRNRQLCGYRFHRQHQIERFIVDFVCLQPKLVIEVDGAIHQQQVEADLEREQIIKSLGIKSSVSPTIKCLMKRLKCSKRSSHRSLKFAEQGTPSSVLRFALSASNLQR